MTDLSCLEKITILLVEDEDSQALLTIGRLKKAGVNATQIIHATSMAAAEMAINKKNIDVILADLTLPDSTGLNTFRKINSLANNAAIIVLSANNDIDIAIRVISEGAQDYLVKDKVEIHSLTRAIIHCLERKKLIDGMHAAEAEAKRQTQLKSAFLAQVSHEIRTPMNGVVGMASLLLHTNITLEQREMLDVIRRSGENLIQIISDILDFSKIEADKLEMIESVFNLRELIEDVLILFYPKAKENGLIIADLISPKTPTLIKGDALRIKQIVSNLVSNAIKNTKSGFVTLSAATATNKQGQDFLIIDIEDSGCGITIEQQEKLFKPFAQLNTGNNQAANGTGLGLAISRSLAELMHGELSLTSTHGVGSKFTLKIPTIIDKQVKIERPMLEGKTVAIICDNVVLKKLSIRQLEMRGLITTEYNSVKQFLDSELNNKNLDLLIVETLSTIDIKFLSDNLRVSKVLVLNSDFSEINTPYPDNWKNMKFPGIQIHLYSTIAALLYPDFASTLPNAASSLQIPLSTVQRSLKILIADDVEINRRIILKMLSHLGHETVCCADGLEALAAFDKENFDLVLIDCKMPNCDGYEATRQMRKHSDKTKAGIPIIALTANALAEGHTECLAAGMVDVLNKPTSLEALARCINNALTNASTASLKTTNINAVEFEHLELLDVQTLETLKSLELEGDEVPFLTSLVQTFIKDTPSLLNRLHNAQTNKAPASEISSLAHKIKGFCRNVGGKQLSDIFELIELHPEQCNDDNLNKVELCFKQTVAALNNYIEY